MTLCKKCGSRVFLVNETITHLEVDGELAKQLGGGDLHNWNCLRCNHPDLYKDFKHLGEGEIRMGQHKKVRCYAVCGEIFLACARRRFPCLAREISRRCENDKNCQRDAEDHRGCV